VTSGDQPRLGESEHASAVAEFLQLRQDRTGALIDIPALLTLDCPEIHILAAARKGLTDGGPMSTAPGLRPATLACVDAAALEMDREQKSIVGALGFRLAQLG
jgi:hypothetical protein